ncbi:hypothetical protein Ancab_003492 [Ancistrocladus abbreviatus]
MGLVEDIIETVKHKASMSKSALLCSPNTRSLRRAVLKATSHDSSYYPPTDKHLSALLSYGNAPRSTASSVISFLMDRLHRTTSSSVALKSLVSLHVIIHRGSFILQDQLAIFPSSGGRNYLKLSDFRDHSSPTNWELSKWVRWCAKFLEQIISTSRVLGCFLFSNSCCLEREKARANASSLLNKDLLGEIDSLICVLEEIGRLPEPLDGNLLVDEVMRLVGEDYWIAVAELVVRLAEFKERLSCLSFAESVELVCALKRLELEGCNENMLLLFGHSKKASAEELLSVVRELEDEVGAVKGGSSSGKEKMAVSGERFMKGSESARYGEPVLKRVNPAIFASNRFESFDVRFSFECESVRR